MTNRKTTGRKKPFPYLPVITLVIALAIILPLSGFTFAASQETHDSFCASCHTQPESTYYQRSISNPPVDLASFHTIQKTRCIDCHSGEGIAGRMQAELMGARNAALWYTGRSIQPAVLTYPISNANCLKCHQDVLARSYVPKMQTGIFPGGGGGGEGGEEEGRANHWHVFLPRWQARASNAATCVSCHPGHSTQGSALTGFQAEPSTQAECEACHRVLREREGGGEGG
jgi:hypothetical protein